VTWLIVFLLLAGIAAFLYNRLVRSRNRARGAWSDIDVQLQRRHDLIPQLVTAVAQYASYERVTLEAVTELRSAAMGATSVASRGEAEQGLSGGLVRLIAVAEQYPDLKANENFLKLQAELVETEDYLQFARRYYNGAVRELNTLIETVPNNFIASLFRFSMRDYFQPSSADVAVAPQIDLGGNE